ncbi:MAG: hypothetical protein RLZZ251_129 [Actinomycetota bacterium]
MISTSTKVKNLALAFFSFFAPRKWGVISETYVKTKFNHAFSVSYSQGGEDLGILSLLNQNSGFYIDVGAHHPHRFSVTRLLYDRGWRGINVDANPDIEHVFQKNRPKDNFIWAAIGTEPEYQFTRFLESAISTTNNQWKDRFVSEGNVIKDVLKVPGKSLFEIISQLDPKQGIDLLNIDIEGSDIEALISMKLEELPKSKIPKILILETSPPVSEALKSSSVKKAIEWGYEPQLVLPMATILGYKSN